MNICMIYRNTYKFNSKVFENTRKQHIMLTIFMAISPFDVLLVGDRFILYFYALMSKNNLRNIILLLFIMITLSVVVTIQTHIWCFNRNSTLSIKRLLFKYQLLKKVIMALTLEKRKKLVNGNSIP